VICPPQTDSTALKPRFICIYYPGATQPSIRAGNRENPQNPDEGVAASAQARRKWKVFGDHLRGDVMSALLRPPAAGTVVGFINGSEATFLSLVAEEKAPFIVYGTHSWKNNVTGILT